MKHKEAKQGHISSTKKLKKNRSGSALECGLRCGTQVACYLPEYEDEEPQIGTIIDIPVASESVEVEWMAGAYSEPWTVCKKREKGRYVTWKQTIPLSSILFPIELTRSCRLNTAFVRKLKHAYKEIKGTD